MRYIFAALLTIYILFPSPVIGQGQDISRCMDRGEFVQLLPRIIMSPAKANVIVIRQGAGLLEEEWRSNVVWIRTLTNLVDHLCIVTTGLII